VLQTDDAAAVDACEREKRKTEKTGKNGVLQKPIVPMMSMPL
jgi:hypothetical protein